MPERKPTAPGIPGVRLPERRQAIPPEPPSEPRAAPIPVDKGAPPSMFARAHVSTLWAAAGRWSPAGIAAALLIVFLALGGREGVVALATGLSDSMSGARALTAEIAALRGEMAKTNELLAAEQRQRQQLSARVVRAEHNLSLVCDLASELNLGKPNATWCAADNRSIKFEAPPAHGGTRAPVHRTAAEWRHE